jgi:hypothetical protein
VGEACSIHGEDEKYTVLIGKQGKRPLGRCRCVWEDNITMDIREIVEIGFIWPRIGTSGGTL